MSIGNDCGSNTFCCDLMNVQEYFQLSPISINAKKMMIVRVSYSGLF